MSVKTLRVNFKPLTERGFSVEERIAAIKVALKNRYGIMIGFNAVSLKGKCQATVVENVVFTAHHFDEEKLTLTGEWMDDHPQAKVFSHFDPERDLIVTLGYYHTTNDDGKIVVTNCFTSGNLAIAALVELNDSDADRDEKWVGTSLDIGDWLNYIEDDGSHWSSNRVLCGYAIESILRGNIVGFRSSNASKGEWTFVRLVGKLGSDDYRIVECRPDTTIITPEKQHNLLHFAHKHYYFTVLNTKVPLEEQCVEVCEDEIER